MRKNLGVGLVLFSVMTGCSGNHPGEAKPTVKARPATPPAADQDAQVPADASTEGVVIKLTEFTVPAGGEMYRCQNFTNPFGSVPVDIDRFEAHMTEGAHHMIVFFDDVTDGALEECSGSEFHPNVFGAQTPDSVMDMPPGVGVAVPPTSGLRLQLHFVNSTAEPITAGVTTKFHVAAPGSITNHAGQLVYSNEEINVPPSVPTKVTKTCTVEKDISVIGASAHVHSHAVDFLATAGSTVIYQTKGWSDLTPARFNPPLALAANQAVTFTCTYVNDTANTIVFGESAVTDEMCILGAIYYPVDDVTSPNITCF